MIQSKIQPPGTMSALVVMGVSGCGKSSAGEAIAQQLGWTLVEGDSYHSPQSVAKMQAGIALTDADREGWLERLAQRLAQADAEHGLVLTCSALKRKYRDQLRSAQQLGFVFLDLDYATALERVQTRPGHFFSPDLVANQFTTLEDPRQEPDVLTVSATMNLNDIALAARQWARRESQA
ncbi:gluconokinase [Comamonas testosteroni]|uniref:gluconokinase n=1 Tax=Comamonas testosteroni TaxID=285 RepID=UPI0006905648|nr:gluconokinase [Comamonas testosteroni]